MAYEYIWHIACHYIAEKAAADSSNDTDEDGEEYGRVLGNLKCAHGTGNGENTKTDRVGSITRLLRSRRSRTCGMNTMRHVRNAVSA